LIKDLKVADMMTRDMTAVSETAPLRDVAKMLSRRRLGGVPVVDEEQHVVGYISVKDIIESVLPGQLSSTTNVIFVRNWAQTSARLSQAGEQLVRDFMSREPVCVSEEDTMVKIAELMVRDRKKVLPVLRDKKLIGVVTRADLCRALMNEDEESES
jgi:CBS domain-containing protein